MISNKTELTLTPADMQQAVEFYLNEQVLREEVRVTDVVEINAGGGSTFRVTFKPAEIEAGQ